MRLCMVVAMLALVAGCRSQQLRHDQDHMRDALLDLYTNQIMDNLIRAHNGMPIVQLDYSNMTGTITHNANGSYGDMQTLETDRNPVVTTLRKFVNVTTFGAGGSQMNQLTITANPVLNNNEVYNAYLEFLAKPEHFMVTCNPPETCEAHIVRCAKDPYRKGKLYYWVPSGAKYDFLRLALVTTVQRGQPLSVADVFENQVTRVEDDTVAKGFILVYLKKPIPNDSGILSFTLANEPYDLATTVNQRKIFDVNKQECGQMKFGQKTNYLIARLPVTKDGFVIRMQRDQDIAAKLKVDDFKAALVGQNVTIDLAHYKPTLPTTEDLLGAIRHEVGLIRLEQNRR
jgi:hypothetical protein